MNQDTSLLAKSPDTTWSFEKATPRPSTNACYRSRIYTADVSINPLIAACDQILSLATILTTSEFPDDRNKFLQDMAHEIRAFEHRAEIANYQPNIIVAARFALCSFLDEIIKLTPWGKNNNWAENNLLTLFHNEHNGDARFFTIIDRALENIPDNIHLVELLYICLNLGFIGKYKKPGNERSELAAITNKLYQITAQYSHHNHKNILIRDQKPDTEQREVVAPKTKIEINPMKLLWLTSALTLIVSGSIYMGVNLKLNSTSKPIHSIIQQIMNSSGEI